MFKDDFLYPSVDENAIFSTFIVYIWITQGLRDDV